MSVAEKKQFPFRLDMDLFQMAVQKAKSERRSFNNYLEHLVAKDVGNIPNDETIKAIEEAMSGDNQIRIEDLGKFFKRLKSEIKNE